MKGILIEITHTHTHTHTHTYIYICNLPSKGCYNNDLSFIFEIGQDLASMFPVLGRVQQMMF